jgi:hypothetical protein
MVAAMPENWFFETLPLHPFPYEGECLSGYLLRLAELNGYAILWDLIGDLFPMWTAPQQTGMLKWEYPLENWGRIPLRTGLTSAELNRLSVASWVEKFRFPINITRSKYMSPGHALHGILNPNLRVCSLCLQSQPYLRLIWRLLPVTTCLDHGCFLEERCSGCGAVLTPVSQDHQHMLCSVCGTDLRSLPVVMAPQDALSLQRQRQDEFQYLLDPATVLAKTGDGFADNPAYTLGLKFRYIRHLAKASTKMMAERTGLHVAALEAIERGVGAALPHYLTYLESIQMSWRKFASLDVPDAFLREIQAPRHLALRVCPDLHCPSHEMHPGAGVFLLLDAPEQHFARLRCKVCGKRFTRSYDGSLRTRPRCPSLQPGEKHNLLKSQAEIASLIEMGLHGECNRQIARKLGWGEKTVRIYWIALGLEGQVHQAQARMRAAKKVDQCGRLGSQIQAILEPLLHENRRLTLQEVHRALGSDCFYLQRHPDQARYLREAIWQHNVRIQQHQDDVVAAQIAKSIASLACADHIVLIDEITGQTGISSATLRENYPALHSEVHQAIQEQRERLKALHLKKQIEQIDRAANLLVAKGVRLTYRTILQEAGLSRYANHAAPIRDALAHWISNLAPRD